MALISVTGLVHPGAIVTLYQRQLPVTTSGIEPATLRLVAQFHKCGVKGGALHPAIKPVESRENSFSIVTRHIMNCREKKVSISHGGKKIFLSPDRHPRGRGAHPECNKIGRVAAFARGRADGAKKKDH